MKFQGFNQAAFRSTSRGIVLSALPNSDMIADPSSGKVTANASFLAESVRGDFCISAKVSHQFTSLYDAACLIAYRDERLWAKACFECSEQDTHRVVTVMTNGTSDDANGERLEDKTVWLQLSRKGNTIAAHYSADGRQWQLARILSLPLPKDVQVGLLAQSPLGDGGEFLFENIEFHETAPENMRTGS